MASEPYLDKHYPPRSATDVRMEKTPFIARVWMANEEEAPGFEVA